MKNYYDLKGFFTDFILILFENFKVMDGTNPLVDDQLEVRFFFQFLAVLIEFSFFLLLKLFI